MQGQHHGTTHPRMISCHSLTTGRNSSPNFFDAYKYTHIHKYSCIHTYAYIVSMHVGVIVLTISIIYNILVVCQSGWLILSVFFFPSRFNPPERISSGGTRDNARNHVRFHPLLQGHYNLSISIMYSVYSYL